MCQHVGVSNTAPSDDGAVERSETGGGKIKILSLRLALPGEPPPSSEGGVVLCWHVTPFANLIFANTTKIGAT